MLVRSLVAACALLQVAAAALDCKAEQTKSFESGGDCTGPYDQQKCPAKQWCAKKPGDATKFICQDMAEGGNCSATGDFQTVCGAFERAGGPDTFEMIPKQLPCYNDLCAMPRGVGDRCKKDTDCYGNHTISGKCEGSNPGICAPPDAWNVDGQWKCPGNGACPLNHTCVSPTGDAAMNGNWVCVPIVLVTPAREGPICPARSNHDVDAVSTGGCAGATLGLSVCMSQSGDVNGTCQGLYAANAVNFSNAVGFETKKGKSDMGAVYTGSIVGGTEAQGIQSEGGGGYSGVDLCRYKFLHGQCTTRQEYVNDRHGIDRTFDLRPISLFTCGSRPSNWYKLGDSCNTDGDCNPGVSSTVQSGICQCSGGASTGGTCHWNRNIENYMLKGPMSPQARVVNCMARSCKNDKFLSWLSVFPKPGWTRSGGVTGSTFGSTCQGICSMKVLPVQTNATVEMASLAQFAQVVVKSNFPASAGPIYKHYSYSAEKFRDTTFADPQGFYQVATAVNPSRPTASKMVWTSVKFGMNLDFDSIGEEGTPEYVQFVVQVENDIATAIGINPERVEIIEIRPATSEDGLGAEVETIEDEVLTASLLSSVTSGLLSAGDSTSPSSTPGAAGIVVTFKVYSQSTYGTKTAPGGEAKELNIGEAVAKFKQLHKNTTTPTTGGGTAPGGGGAAPGGGDAGGSASASASASASGESSASGSGAAADVPTDGAPEGQGPLYVGCEQTPDEPCKKGKATSSVWTSETNTEMEPEVVGGQGLWFGLEWRWIYLAYFAVLVCLCCGCYCGIKHACCGKKGEDPEVSLEENPQAANDIDLK